jgi:hypothetical protein
MEWVNGQGYAGSLCPKGTKILMNLACLLVFKLKLGLWSSFYFFIAKARFLKHVFLPLYVQNYVFIY